VTSPARSSSPADGLDPDHLLDEPLIAEALQRYSAEKSVPIEQVRKEARGYFAEMLASHTDRATSTWNRFGSWMLRAHDVVVDEEVLVRLRELDRKHSLALVFSHRSYLDGWVLPLALAARRFSPTFTFGGANLDMPFLGRLASNTGIIFIRRATKDVPVYRLALRGYIAYLVRHKANLAWSIEGGRTRTGKLRPPVHGILRYLADATEAAGPSAPDAMVVPIAIVYDQLHEVGRMTAEAKGGRKRPEDFRWLVSFARSQQRRLGRAYLSVGEPIPLRGRMTELRAEGNDTNRAVERVALDVSHRINRATPVTVTAIVCLALLGADRALCFDRVLDTVSPLARYIADRNWPVAGAATLTDRSTIRRALQELVASGVLSCYEAGTEPVWRIAPDQHLIAAFYRNTVIHILVERAIGEVALLAAGTAIPGPDGQPVDAVETAWERALELRDLLKFEFFFPSREEFRSELRAELALLAPDLDRPLTPESAAELLIHARPHLAHLVLRPFLDAYLLVADRLVAAGDADVLGADQDAVLTEALHVGEQWELERRIASAESVSLELFRTGLKLAGHRGLLTSDGAPDLARRRGAFRDELAANVARLDEIAELARRASEERHGAQ
jgi:glycerol-3-phosphate O-acyltransferase